MTQRLYVKYPFAQFSIRHWKECRRCRRVPNFFEPGAPVERQIDKNQMEHYEMTGEDDDDVGSGSNPQQRAVLWSVHLLLILRRITARIFLWKPAVQMYKLCKLMVVFFRDQRRPAYIKQLWIIKERNSISTGMHIWKVPLSKNSDLQTLLSLKQLKKNNTVIHNWPCKTLAQPASNIALSVMSNKLRNEG